MKTIVIYGAAPCTGEDLDRMDRSTFDHMAIGMDAADKWFGCPKYVATNHPEDVPEIRHRFGHIPLIIGPRPHEGFDIVAPYDPIRERSGGSAMTGVLAALRMGYERVILCGIPLTGFAPEGNPYEAFRLGWQDRKRELMGRVKSWSGWTRELLGEPTKEWLSATTSAITICACWDGRDYYPPEYVNKLYRGVERNTTIPFNFVLYVGPEAHNGRLDTIDDRIRVIPTELPFWWSGMKAWEAHPEGVETQSILYCDLDVVILGSLDEIINYPSDHCYMKDFPAHRCPRGKENDGNASVTLIRNGAGAAIWNEYERMGKPVWNPLQPPSRRELPLAVQTLLNDKLRVRHDVFPEQWIASHTLQVKPRGLPQGCKVVSFHGRPKPHELKDAWIRENWI